MLYSDWFTAWTTMLGVTDTAGLALATTIAPRAIEYAELRIYRDPDLDFLKTRTQDNSARTTVGAREVPIPSEMVVIEGVNIITPANMLPPPIGTGTRLPMQRVSVDVLNQIYPSVSTTQTPAPFQMRYAILDLTPDWHTNSILIAPTVDNTYVVEFVGTFRPAPLNSGTNLPTGVQPNTETFLTDNLPDLFLAASLVFGFGWLRDFGRQADDPQTAQSWENQYQILKQGAAVEEARKKALAAAGTPYVPTRLPKLARGET